IRHVVVDRDRPDRFTLLEYLEDHVPTLAVRDDLDPPLDDQGQEVRRISGAPEIVASRVVLERGERRESTLVLGRQAPEERRRLDRAQDAIGFQIGRRHAAASFARMTVVMVRKSPLPEPPQSLAVRDGTRQPESSTCLRAVIGGSARPLDTFIKEED